MDKRYEAALQAVLADLTADPEVVGILFTGSVHQGRPDHTSDDHILAPFGGRLQVWESKKVNYPGGTDQ